MASSWCAQNAILTDENFLHTISGADSGDQLDELWIIKAPISTNDKKAILSALRYGKDDTGDEGLAVMGLLEDRRLFAKAGAGK